MTIKKIRVKELLEFCNSKMYADFVVKPISPLRALSYVNNPRSNPDNYVLYMLFNNNNIIAFRTVLPDYINGVMFAWLSGVWVDNTHRGMKLSMSLFDEIFVDYNGKLAFTNYTGISEYNLLSTKKFAVVKNRTGKHFYFYPDFKKDFPHHKVLQKLPLLFLCRDFIDQGKSQINVYRLFNIYTSLNSYSPKLQNTSTLSSEEMEHLSDEQLKAKTPEFKERVANGESLDDLLYEAFGWDLPEFAHMPLIRNTDKSKLSKRKNDVSILSYREKGYLPEAVRNFIALLGWSHPEGKEIFSFKEFLEVMSLDRIQTTGPVFDTDKLNWYSRLTLLQGCCCPSWRARQSSPCRCCLWKLRCHTQLSGPKKCCICC